MKRSTMNVLLLAAMVSLTGCASMYDGMIGCETGMRNHVLASKAWGHWSWCYEHLDHPRDFAKGFKAGYQDVLAGGNGCQPTLPPQCYWKPFYQTPKGVCRIHAWFDGYSHGALAAKQDGYGALSEIPISPTARANIETSRRKPDPNFYRSGVDYGPPLMMPGTEIPVAPPVPATPDHSTGQPIPVPPTPKTPDVRPYE
ncbi:MAG: hypothetical protein R3C49_01550 [Planctomycetaceae bacterium]